MSKTIDTGAFLHRRNFWIDYVNADYRLSHAAVRLGTFLALRMNENRQFCDWTVEKLHDATHISTAGITRCTQQLEGFKLLKVDRAHRAGNRYELLMPYSIKSPSRHGDRKDSLGRANPNSLDRGLFPAARDYSLDNDFG